MAESGTSPRAGMAPMLAGVVVEVAGIALVIAGLPEMDALFMTGVGMILAGSGLISFGVLQRVSAAKHHPPGPAEEGPAEEETPSRWRPERELRFPPPRAVALRPRGKRRIMIWVVIMALTPVYVYFASSQGPPRASRQGPGYGETEALVHDKLVRETAKGLTYHVYYHFNDEAANEFRGSASVSKALYDDLEVGDRLQVVYLRDQPSAHEVPRLLNQARSSQAAGLAALLAILLLTILETVRRRHRRLTSEGVAVRGEVETARRRGLAYNYTLSYLAGGRKRTLRGTEREQALKPGDALTVLHSPEKPQSALVYRLSLYEAAGPRL